MVTRLQLGETASMPSRWCTAPGMDRKLESNTSNSESGKLSYAERAAYSAGDFASNFYWKLIDYYLLIFYTDVFGISGIAAGTMLLVTKTWDAINDPLMGLIADRTNTRWGKFRPYLLWGALPLGAAGVLTFTTPELSESGKLVWAYITYSLMMTAYTFVNLPYSGLLGVITPDSQERTTLASWRFIGAFSGGIVTTQFTLRLVEYFGGDDPKLGWQLTAAFWAVCAAALFTWSFLGTRERVSPPVHQKPSVKRDFGDLLRNRPWLVLAALAILVMLNMSIRSQITAYYMKYYANAEELTGPFISSSLVASLLGAASTPLWTRLLGKKKLFFILMGLLTMLSLVFFVIPRDAIWLMFGVNILINFVMGPKAPLVFAMYADAADYGEWKFGRRATGFIFAAASFAQKLGGALAGYFIGLMFAAMGYRANVEQTEDSLFGILLLMSVIPSVFSLIALFVVTRYPLSEPELAEIGSDLSARERAT